MIDIIKDALESIVERNERLRYFVRDKRISLELKGVSHENRSKV